MSIQMKSESLIMKKISCVGYHATGSGAVDDFLREFENIQTAKYGIESRFLQDPDGISDLEYNLVENPHRLNSGFALKRFLLAAKEEERTYRHIFGKHWMKWAKEYVEELSAFSYAGYWHADVRLLPFHELFIYKARRAINKVTPSKFRKNKYYNYLPNIKTYCVDLTEKKFLEITRKKCEELCRLLNTDNKEYVVLDQVVSPQNVNRYLRYITDLKVIVVDRDPRDVFINDVIRNKDYVLPKNVDEFCQVFKMSRKTVSNSDDTERVLRINFEDMIYRYDETTLKIMEFLGLSSGNHKYPKRYFNPDKSKANTKQWERFPELQNEVARIEELLPEMLHEY